MANTAMKTARTLQPSASNAADATTTGDVVDLTTALGMVITATITNGATGPGAGCAFIVEVSNDGVTWCEFSRQVAGLQADAVYVLVVELPAAVMYARSTFTGNTAQAVTIEAQGHELTSIG